jgi:predicted N-formylglutamate amidohydrolase
MGSNATSAPVGAAVQLVISAEHASREVPDDLALGVPEEVLASHVAWDPGARQVALRLAERFAAPLFLGRFTRLVADLNRSPESPEAVPARAFGVDVPANQGLSLEAVQARLFRYHAPHWAAVEACVRERAAVGPVLHLSVHSFTDVYQGQVRDLDLGILFDPDRPLELSVAEHLERQLAGGPDIVRRNAPYDGRADALTTALRRKLGERLPYAGVEIELSHRRLGDLDRLGERLAAALLPLVHRAP